MLLNTCIVSTDAHGSINMESCTAGSAVVQRRMMFATHFLPPDLPNYWNIIAGFASKISSENITPQSARMAMENMKVINPEEFISDTLLIKEIIGIECNASKKPLGIPLIPNQTHCVCCSGKLLLRSDRPSLISLYTNSLATVPATHFHKYCQNNRSGCRLVQYGYHKNGNANSQYSTNWSVLPYSVLSQETGFEMELLKQFDVELLIGQISYKQKADIYNVAKGYNTTQKKKSSTKETSKSEHKPPIHGYVKSVVTQYIYNYDVTMLV